MATKYLGGSEQSIAQVQERVKRCLRPLRGRNLGWFHQCYCGGMIYVKYRGRVYCQKCGRFNPDRHNLFDHV